MRKLLLAGVMVLGVANAAMADHGRRSHTSVSVGVGFSDGNSAFGFGYHQGPSYGHYRHHRPVVVAPPPVVYAPAPVVYAPPPPVVYQPAPVVYAPPPPVYVAPAPVVYQPAPVVVAPAPVIYPAPVVYPAPVCATPYYSRTSVSVGFSYYR